jgi:hypothetical protein
MITNAIQTDLVSVSRYDGCYLLAKEAQMPEVIVIEGQDGRPGYLPKVL